MIRRAKVPKQLIAYIRQYLEKHNLGNRGFEDGNKRKQEVGLIGELIVHNYLLNSYPNLDEKQDGFDGGFDLTYRGKTIDVKTMERKSYVRPHYVNNFYIIQEAHEADIIVFCSYHSVDEVIQLCGWLPKSELSNRGIYYAAGTIRNREDGSSFEFRQDNYEVENQNLDDIQLLKELQP